ncbi:MAG: chemotaxis protein CheB [Acidobacteria bacterium]|nr:MAG: chemotaxis protein CheB [Acidobacteriota bacterium]PYV72952.1 MAG: chemotaxis protein CheB [Acidobacteriota bacterium]
MATKTKRARPRRSPWCRLVAIGASAGGLAALSALIDGLNSEFPPIVVVQHLDPHHKSHLASVLARKTRKPVKEAEDGEPISQSTIYIGPPDEHLLVAQGRIQLAHSRLIRFSRPSIDLLFAAVAAIYGEHSIGVILSGSNRDGADGIAAIRRAGGVTIAQDPVSAEYRVMPQAAIDTGCVDLVVPLDQMGSVLSRLFVEGKTRKWPEMFR